jgi:hypothetical protein
MILQVAKANHKDQARIRHRNIHRPKSERPVAAAARHGSYASMLPRKSSDPRLGAAPMAPLPVHAAYRKCLPPRDHRFTSSMLHASFALCRLAIWVSPPPLAAAAEKMARGGAARVDLGLPLSPKQGNTRGLIGHVGGDGGDWRLRSGSKEAMSVNKSFRWLNFLWDWSVRLQSIGILRCHSIDPKGFIRKNSNGRIEIL